MPLASILAMAWLVGTPALGVVSFPQDTPAANSTQSPAPAPPETTQTAPTKGKPLAAEHGASDSAAKKKAASAPASQRAKRRRVRKPTQPGEPRKRVVREGGAIEPPAKIVPGLTPQEAGQQRQTAEDLLSRTEENLKQLAGRTLDSPRQETVAQIHNYVEGARSALKDGDTQRAHTLALKAHLLADDLLKH
jgi:hypothetical protein